MYFDEIVEGDRRKSRIRRFAEDIAFYRSRLEFEVLNIHVLLRLLHIGDMNSVTRFQ